jgi:hypothetical protein
MELEEGKGSLHDDWWPSVLDALESPINGYDESNSLDGGCFSELYRAWGLGMWVPIFVYLTIWAISFFPSKNNNNLIRVFFFYFFYKKEGKTNVRHGGGAWWFLYPCYSPLDTVRESPKFDHRDTCRMPWATWRIQWFYYYCSCKASFFLTGVNFFTQFIKLILEYELIQ